MRCLRLRRDRKLNLIVSGFSEQGNDLEEFILFVNNGHDLPQSVEAKDIVAMERIGRPPGQGRPRLLRIQFNSAGKRRIVLTMTTHLRDRYKKPLFQIFIRPDLTRAQQEHDKMLRQELMSEGKGKEKYMIRRGRVVMREPERREAEGGREMGGGGERRRAAAGGGGRDWGERRWRGKWGHWTTDGED